MVKSFGSGFVLMQWVINLLIVIAYSVVGAVILDFLGYFIFGAYFFTPPQFFAFDEYFFFANIFI